MKYLKKIFEQTEFSIPEEIVDNFLGIYDLYGEPEITLNSRFFRDAMLPDDRIIYTLSWDLDELVNDSDVDVFCEGLDKLYKIKEEVLQAKKRLHNYDIAMSLVGWAGGMQNSHCLVIKLLPKLER